MKSTIALLFLIICNYLSFAQKQNILQIIDKAGKQRTLCEQVTKNYLMIGAVVKPEDSQSEFDDAKFSFSKNLLFLNDNCKLIDTKLAIINLTNLWAGFKTLIESKPTRDNVILVMSQSNLVQIACNEMVVKVYQEFNIKNSRLLNLCNKQRFNTQKIAKFCVARNWKILYPDIEKDLTEAIVSYEFSLSQMLTSQDNTPETSKILEQLLSDWGSQKINFALENNVGAPEKAVEKTNIILADLNKLILLFQKNALVVNGITGL